jgi:hypothetical protein
MEYVTFDAATGILTGSFDQDLHPLHATCYIPVSASVRAQWARYRANDARDGVELIGEAPPAAPSVEQLAAQYIVSVQARLDAAARALGYDSIANAVTYADEPAVARFQDEGRALRAWRSLVWEFCYALLDQAKAGEIELPTEQEVLSSLPVAPARSVA